MARYGIKNSLKGKINKDADYRGIQNGDYTDANDIVPYDRASHTALSVQPTLGNEFAALIPSSVPHNKKFRITVLTTGNYELTAYKTDGVSVMFVASFTDLATCATSLVTAASTSGFGLTLQVTATTATYIEVQLSVPQYYDWVLQSTGSDKVLVQITEESQAINYIGKKNIIGSCDVLGNLFCFSTSNVKERQTSTLIDIFNVSGRIYITVNDSIPLENGIEILIQGTSSNRNADGIWVISNVTTNPGISYSAELVLSDGSTLDPLAPITGEVVFNFRGVGEIGVFQHNPNLLTDQWTYTKLLNSKELDFSIFYQIECRSELNNLGYALYYHQVKRNPPCVFYYNNPLGFIDNGALTINGGQYEYGNLNNELILQTTTEKAIITFVNQFQTGGSIKSGNKRYIFRLSNDSKKDYWSLATNLINVYSASNSVPTSIVGNDISTLTTKRNLLRVSGINVEVYKYIELGVIEYSGGIGIATNLYRVDVTGTEMELFHTGTETTSSVIPIEELLSNNQLNIKSCGSELILDNRHLIGNINYSTNPDLGVFVNTIKYRLNQYKIPSETSGSYPSFQYGGYQNPETENKNMGYFLNEEYRFGFEFEFLDGSVSETFFYADIRFDTNTTSVDGKRLSGLPNYDLVSINPDTGAIEMLVPYVTFENINWEFIYNQNPLWQSISKINVMIAPRIPEVLAMGFVISSIDVVMPDLNKRTVEWFNAAGATQYVSGLVPYPNATLPNVLPSLFPLNETFENKRIVSFYSADISYDLFVPNSLENCILRTFEYSSTYENYENSLSNSEGTYIPLNTPLNCRDSLFEIYGIDFQNTTDYVIQNAVVLSRNDNPYHFVVGDKTFYKNTPFFGAELVSGVPVPYSIEYNMGKSLVINLASDYDTLMDINNRLRVAQIIKPIQNKYGDINFTKYNHTGYFALRDENSIMNFGGDAYMSKTWQRLVYMQNGQKSEDLKAGIGVGFYSQSVMNFDMRAYLSDLTGQVFPASSSDYKVWCETFDNDQYLYDSDYNYYAPIESVSTFSTQSIYINQYKTRIIYSLLKPQGSIIDLYRIFPPLQFYDLDPQYGEIVHMESFNGQLMVWQQRKFSLLYFNTTGVLSSAPGEIVLLGNTGVLNRKPNELTSFGTNHKWSVVKGQSMAGVDVLYWVNSEYGTVMRLGADGTNNLSILWGMFAFFNNNLTWVQGKDNPASGQGICAVWDERYKEYIITVQGQRYSPEWIQGSLYKRKEIVNNPLAIPTTFNGGLDIYECTQDHTANSTNMPGVGVDWEQYWSIIPHDNPDYYNEYTVGINEVKNGFSSFYTFKPNIYLKWSKTFLTPSPKKDDRNRVYEHRKGEYAAWWKNGETELIGNPYVESVINYDSDMVKWYHALFSNSKQPPHRIEAKTETQETFITSDAWEYRENNWVAAIPNDSTVTGETNGDTSQLFGNYIRIKFVFLPKTFNRIYDFVCLVANSLKSYRK